MSERHCCNRKRWDRQADAMLHLADKMERHAANASPVVESKFLLWPRRDPRVNTWFWLRRVRITRKAVVKWVALSWGLGVVPYIDWVPVEIRPA